MNLKSLTPIALALAVTGCVSNTYVVEYDATADEPLERIRSSLDFAETVVGKRLSSNGVTLVVRNDGRVTGSGQAGRVALNWDWRGGYYCREGTVGGIQVEEDCEAVYTTGRTVHFVSNRGSGQGVEYAMR